MMTSSHKLAQVESQFTPPRTVLLARAWPTRLPARAGDLPRRYGDAGCYKTRLVQEARWDINRRPLNIGSQTRSYGISARPGKLACNLDQLLRAGQVTETSASKLDKDRCLVMMLCWLIQCCPWT
jgi:hypothetical protein